MMEESRRLSRRGILGGLGLGALATGLSSAGTGDSLMRSDVTAVDPEALAEAGSDSLMRSDVTAVDPDSLMRSDVTAIDQEL